MVNRKILLATASATALFAACATVLLASCGEKKQHTNIITEQVERPQVEAPIRQAEYDKTHEVQWMGKGYKVEIHRQPNDSLPMVTDEIGQKFVDNEVEVTVRRADGTVFFSHAFTKASFDACLDNDYRHTGILDGLVYDKTNGSHLEFAGSVSHPQTDEYIPVRVILSPSGNVTFKRDVEGNEDDGMDEVAD